MDMKPVIFGESGEYLRRRGIVRMYFGSIRLAPGSARRDIAGRVVAEASPKVSGLFEESITVRCNGEKNLELIIRGNAL
jgi:hypothetical protein